MAGAAALLAASSLRAGPAPAIGGAFSCWCFPWWPISVFWFISAPDPRYFGSTMWIFAICPALTFATGDLRGDGRPCLPVSAQPRSRFSFRMGIPVGMDLCGRAPTELSGGGNPPRNQPAWRSCMDESRRSFSPTTLRSQVPGRTDHSWPCSIPKKGIAGGFKFLKPSSLSNEP